MEKIVDNTTPSILDQITFTITASNTGNVDATNVEILEVIPSGYEFIDAVSTSGTYDEVTGVWNIPNIETNSEEMLSIEVKVLDVDDYVNTVSVQGLDQIDGDSTNDAATASITPNCLTIYNKFSPNGNGANEFFTIDCISNYPNNKLEIYNRWGNIVYSKNGYDNSFDGTSNGRVVLHQDRKLPTGTYYYVLDLGDGSEEKVGWVYIVR